MARTTFLLALLVHGCCAAPEYTDSETVRFKQELDELLQSMEGSFDRVKEALRAEHELRTVNNSFSTSSSTTSSSSSLDDNKAIAEREMVASEFSATSQVPSPPDKCSQPFRSRRKLSWQWY